MSSMLILFLSQQADNFCNSFGILQQMSQPSPLSGYGSTTTKVTTPDTDHTLLFAQMIAKTAKDILSSWRWRGLLLRSAYQMS